MERFRGLSSRQTVENYGCKHLVMFLSLTLLHSPPHSLKTWDPASDYNVKEGVTHPTAWVSRSFPASAPATFTPMALQQAAAAGPVIMGSCSHAEIVCFTFLSSDRSPSLLALQLPCRRPPSLIPHSFHSCLTLFAFSS